MRCRWLHVRPEALRQGLIIAPFHRHLSHCRSGALRGVLSGPASRRAAELVLTGGLLLAAGGAWAQSVTAESVWGTKAAQQEAMSQLPKNVTVTRTSCQEIGMSGNNYRYRCTVFYSANPVPQSLPPGNSPP